MQTIKEIYELYIKDKHPEFNLNQCPKCKRKGLWIKDNHCTCFRVSCGFRGNEYDYYGAFFNEDSKAVYFKLNKDKPEAPSTFNIELQTLRRNMLNNIFQTLKKSRTNKTKEVVDYIESRGWNINDIEYAYWPPDNWLQSNTDFSVAALKKFKFINDKNQEIFSNRIIFPIKNIEGEIVYIQGRSLDPKCDLRWLTGHNDPNEESVFNYFYNTNILKEFSKENSETLFVCEGISDAISLQKIGVNVISSLNLFPPLFKYKRYLRFVESVIIIYDNDKTAIETNKSKSSFKSWNSVLDKVIELQIALPQIKIYCVTPPEITGITDINEWLLHINYDKEVFEKYIYKKSKLLEYFMVDNFLNKLEDILKLIKLKKGTDQKKIANYLQTTINSKFENNWINAFLNSN
jgi:hypothetical protein